MNQFDLNALADVHGKGLEFGSIQLTLKYHLGRLHKVDVSKSTSVKVDGSNPEADAAAIMISVMKGRQTHLVKGSLGFGVFYDHMGKPTNVQVQEFMEEKL